MKIESATTTTSTVSETRHRKPASPAAGATAAEVNLSEVAAQLQSSGDTPAFDAGRVSEIKQAIAGGQFTINAEAIADRLIASASELIGSRQQP